MRICGWLVDYQEATTITLVRTNKACPSCTCPEKDFDKITSSWPTRTTADMKKIWLECEDMKQRGQRMNAAKLAQKYGISELEVSP